MRDIQYLSPSSIAAWHKNKEEFYLTYLADERAPRFAQLQVMSIGSSFDAYAKSFLHHTLFGANHKDAAKFDLKTLFEAQVEPHNRDWAWTHGKYAFEAYKKSGALADLMLDLKNSIGEPQFEFELRGAVNGHREGVTRKMEQGVIFLGKPDIFFNHKLNFKVTLDFKVNGYCSKASPKPGYLRIRSGDDIPITQGPHKNCMAMNWRGIMINVGQFLEQIDLDWARQLAIYSWLSGAEVGEEFLVAIDQLACKKTEAEFPQIRVAEHRLRVSTEFQWQEFARCQDIWEIIHSDWIFRDKTREDSIAYCKSLDMKANQLKNPATEEDKIFNTMTR